MDKLLVDTVYGGQLKSLLYKGDDHRDFLKFVRDNQEKAQSDISTHFDSEFIVHSFNDRSVEQKVDPRDCKELAGNSLVSSPLMVSCTHLDIDQTYLGL